jgi:poly(A) polymerase
MSIMQKKQNVSYIHHVFPIESIDHDALSIIRKLNKFGYLGYLVGGCVRDLLLGYKAKDFDIVTSARPREIRQLFKSARIIGRRFQLVHIQMSSLDPIEVATFRRSPMPDAHRGDLIVDDNEFGTTETDAKRRDFTVNALFYDPIRYHIYDYCDGLNDIKEKQLRSIGDPKIRFREDPIRMLRAIKFAARLSLQFDHHVSSALTSERLEIQKAAAPRLLQELLRMLQGGAAERSYQMLWHHQFLHVIAPELVAAFMHDSQIAQRSFQLLARLDAYESDYVWSEASLLSILYLPMCQRLTSSHDFKQHLHLTLRRLFAPFATRVGMPFKLLRKMTHAIGIQLQFDRLGAKMLKQTINKDALHLLNLRALDEPLIQEVSQQIQHALKKQKTSQQTPHKHTTKNISHGKLRRRTKRKRSKKHIP